MTKVMTRKVLHSWVKYLLNGYFLTCIAKNQVKSHFFAKIVNDFQLLTFFAKKSHHKCLNVSLLPVKKKKQIMLYDFKQFYVILYNFLNCPDFIDIEKPLHYKVAIA